MHAPERRPFLHGAGRGVGAAAFARLLAEESGASVVRRGAGRAKRVIWLTMAGGPSQLELLDPKPDLARMHGTPMPASLVQGRQLAQLQGKPLRCLGPQFGFRRYGKSGIELGELIPRIGSVVDDLCVVRSMTTDAINHDPAHMFMNTGSQIAGRPSMGAWVAYGLGYAAKELPGFVVLVSTGKGRSPQPISQRQWSAGMLPGRHQGVQLRGQGDPVHYLSSPPGVDRGAQGEDIDTIRALDRRRDRWVDDPELATRIAQYELAFRMQSSVPQLMDISDEKGSALEAYGCTPGDGSFASNCLLARRLAERGVPFIQLYHRDWDHHSQLREELPTRAREVDRACAALIRDLQARGMFDDTLVVWTGEFGRTPMSQSDKGTVGRDHHNLAMSMWLAGAGVRGGMVHGATDDLGYAAVRDVCTVHDLHATMLHVLGLEPERLSVRSQGLDVRLIGVEPAKVLTALLR
ncbi:MAG: DUF1501 domain-containing protein [Armatimonadota bacterium]